MGVGAVAVAVTVAAAGLVKRVRWPPAVSKLRTWAAARRVVWNCKQVTPETGIEAREGLKKEEPRMPCVCLVYCTVYFLTAGADGLGRYWSQQRGRNQNSNGSLGVFRRQAGGRGREAGSSVDE